MIQVPESAGHRFKVGDRICLRRRFVRLYPAESGVIIGVIPDPMRSLFNEYLIEFPDRSTASLFQFQIYREESHVENSAPSQAL